jgi:hypothetical protein
MKAFRVHRFIPQNFFDFFDLAVKNSSLVTPRSSLAAIDL